MRKKKKKMNQKNEPKKILVVWTDLFFICLFGAGI